MTENVLPEASEWNAAVEHSKAHPAHILGPYQGADGVLHMYCDGSGDRNEPSNCDFTTERTASSRFQSSGPPLVELDAYGDFSPERRQSTTACCPRETIPDSCSCPDGCACMCADCECDDMAEFFDQWPETAADVRITVMSGQEAGLQRLRQQAGTAGGAITEYAQLDGNGVFLVWDVSPDGEERFSLAERIKAARSFGGIIFRRRVIVVENWEEVTEQSG